MAIIDEITHLHRYEKLHEIDVNYFLKWLEEPQARLKAIMVTRDVIYVVLIDKSLTAKYRNKRFLRL